MSNSVFSQNNTFSATSPMQMNNSNNYTDSMKLQNELNELLAEIRDGNVNTPVNVLQGGKRRRSTKKSSKKSRKLAEQEGGKRRRSTKKSSKKSRKLAEQERGKPKRSTKKSSKKSRKLAEQEGGKRRRSSKKQSKKGSRKMNVLDGGKRKRSTKKTSKKSSRKMSRGLPEALRVNIEFTKHMVTKLGIKGGKHAMMLGKVYREMAKEKHPSLDSVALTAKAREMFDSEEKSGKAMERYNKISQ
jgi:hypothetical protein